jgi:glycosyltransferase involved in cell wall biosynthesis
MAPAGVRHFDKTQRPSRGTGEAGPQPTEGIMPLISAHRPFTAYDFDRAADMSPLSLDQEPLDVSQRLELLQRLLGDGLCRQLGIYPLPEGFRLSVVVPCYNEQHTIREIVRRIKEVPIPKEIIIIDDASGDGTRAVLKQMEGEPDVRILYHEQNRGKGAALKTGFAHATGDVVLVQDADLEYDPVEYPRLIQPIVEGRADAVFGSRFLGDRSHRVLYYWHYLGNQFLTLLSNAFTNLNLTDMETCYKVFRRELIAEVTPTLKQDRFGIEPELTAKIARRNARIYEIAISYSGRTYKEGKKIGWKDGVKALWCILRYSKWD